MSNVIHDINVHSSDVHHNFATIHSQNIKVFEIFMCLVGKTKLYLSFGLVIIVMIFPGIDKIVSSAHTKFITHDLIRRYRSHTEFRRFQLRFVHNTYTKIDA